MSMDAPIDIMPIRVYTILLISHSYNTGVHRHNILNSWPSVPIETDMFIEVAHSLCKRKWAAL